jgi:hypothetical protein
MSKVKIQGHASGTGVLTVTAPNTSTDRTITLPDATGTLATTADSVGGANGVDFNDNVKARFGTGNDLEIYHDGGDSIIADTGTGDLLISGSSTVRIDGSGETMINCTDDGAVTLYHNNAAKIATTATGVDVTGAIAGATNLGKVLQVKEVAAHSAVASNPSSYTTLYSLTITPTSSSSKILVTAMVGGLYLNYAGNTNNTNWRLARGSSACSGANTHFHTEVGRNDTGTGSRAYINMQILDEPNTTSATTYNVQVIRQNGSGGISIGDTAGTSTLTLMEIGA